MFYSFHSLSLIGFLHLSDLLHLLYSWKMRYLDLLFVLATSYLFVHWLIDYFMTKILCTNMHINSVTRGRYWFICVKIRWICQCVHLSFQPSAWLPPTLFHHVAMLNPLLRCTDFFFACFWGCRFCGPAINQTCLSQSRNWFSFFAHERNIIKLVRWVSMQLHEEKCVPSSFLTNHKINLIR